jgi:hypothetical protein
MSEQERIEFVDIVEAFTEEEQTLAVQHLPISVLFKEIMTRYYSKEMAVDSLKTILMRA